jgi:short-subunit dehydrogenase
MAGSARPIALITGASAGIGVALAREAANDGHDLILVARRREPMEALAAELKLMGAGVTVIPADLNRPGAAAALMGTVEQRGLAIHTLINNAGLGDAGRFDQENPGKILSMLQVNIIALTELTRLVLPQMVARKHGKVMLLASLAAFQPGPGMAVYYATKAYVLSFGRAIGHELRGTGVTITTLCPGPTTSEFAEVANMQGVALFEGPVPVMTAAEVARQGYAALKAGRPQIITGVINRITAISTRFTPTPILLTIAGRLNRRPGGGQT